MSWLAKQSRASVAFNCFAYVYEINSVEIPVWRVHKRTHLVFIFMNLARNCGILQAMLSGPGQFAENETNEVE
jgi:hypothetical protein